MRENRLSRKIPAGKWCHNVVVFGLLQSGAGDITHYHFCSDEGKTMHHEPATQPETIHLKDYTPPPFQIPETRLLVEIGAGATLVHSELLVQRVRQEELLTLDGEGLELVRISLDGRELSAGEYQLDAESLTIPSVPDRFTLSLTTRIFPEKNTELEGLYRSKSIYCTQCEAQGFRRITYFLDRPDVLSRFTTTIVAPKESCPVLLANGNLAGRADLGRRHSATWEDPFPKPCYLFALVAGRLVSISDTFTTRSGKNVLLEVYVEEHNRERCDHALSALKKAMRWEEDRFGLEYDLSRYMIVAVDDFNMGAMENKGLNIFNSKYVLAGLETATDEDFAAIEEVIAHEYLHNWTGNRVTCRDWFQLSLKEGLTVFRDQLFSEEMVQGPVKRIRDVKLLMTHQFAEDAGPMAHPVRPQSYIEINNFYTLTVYEKGAELVRMLFTLLGEQTFLEGFHRYIARYDSTAATVEDFVSAMEEASGRDLSRFMRWYDQAGTPVVEVKSRHDPEAARLVLSFRQWCPPTPGQDRKEPCTIPIRIGLIDDEANEVWFRVPSGERLREWVFELSEARQELVLEEVATPCVASLLRGFSAPVKIEYHLGREELLLLAKGDPDPVNRWMAGQRFMTDEMLTLVERFQQEEELSLAPGWLELFGALLGERQPGDKGFAAELLEPPSERFLAEQLALIDVDAVHGVRRFVVRALGESLRERFTALYHELVERQPYRYDPVLAGRRRLKNLALSFLAATLEEEDGALCKAQFEKADNLTDSLAALRLLVHHGYPEAASALASFEKRWRHEPLVLDKWFAVQATAPLPGTLERVSLLVEHPCFDPANPNRVRALIGSFAAANPVCFHAPDGQGYRFLAQWILSLDRTNPQVAARLATHFSQWRRYPPDRQGLMRVELERMASEPRLSRDLYEVVTKSLGG